MVDQVTRRRIMRSGVTAYDKRRACPGYVLYCPSFYEGVVQMMDLSGEVVHRWEMPYWPRHWGHLIDNGNLFYLGRLSDEDHSFPGWRHEIGGALIEVDWDGNTVWEHQDRSQHHDGRRTDSGGAIYLTVETVPPEIARQLKVVLPVDDPAEMWADLIVEVDHTGRRIWEWHAYEHLDFDKHVLPPNVVRYEWTHANTIVPLPEQKVLVSFRHISTIAIVDKLTGDLSWSIGHETVSGQHDASMLSDGHILVFDNGLYRSDTFQTYSRVLEIHPNSNKIVWQYQAPDRNSFYSPIVSGAQRLPNGNTLILEGRWGRLFQVTPDGEVVWEYINPCYSKWETGDGFTNVIFRARHYTKDEVPGLQ